MYSFPYLEPVCCSMSSSNCCFLICIQISLEAGEVFWYSHLFKNSPEFVVIHTVIYGCESWTIKKAERWRIDTFKLWCWRRLLRVPWTARRSNQAILKEISPEYSLEGQMLKLKLQYFGHLMQRIDSFEKTLLLGKIEGKKIRGWQRMRWLDGITDYSGYEFEEADGDGQVSLMSAVHGVTKSQTQLSNWTELNVFF